jgi:hypothetical protein
VFEEFSKIVSWDGTTPRRLATSEMLRNLIRSIPSEYICEGIEDPLNPAYNGFILRNGSRIYIDGPFLEYATAECFSVREVGPIEVVAGEMLAAAAAGYFKKTGRTLKIYKMIPDEEGNVAGYHENYGLRQDRCFNLFGPNF